MSDWIRCDKTSVSCKYCDEGEILDRGPVNETLEALQAFEAAHLNCEAPDAKIARLTAELEAVKTSLNAAEKATHWFTQLHPMSEYPPEGEIVLVLFNGRPTIAGYWNYRDECWESVMGSYSQNSWLENHNYRWAHFAGGAKEN
jgi:hypothetical protein